MALVEGCKHSLEISVPVVEVEKETERAVAEIQRKVKLPGFRPGKAPLGLVKQRFAGDIRQDVLEKLVPRFFRAAADKDHLEVVGQPNVSDVNFKAGEPITFKAEFEVARSSNWANTAASPSLITSPKSPTPKSTPALRKSENRKPSTSTRIRVLWPMAITP
jgi:hypothetical protein